MGVTLVLPCAYVPTRNAYRRNMGGLLCNVVIKWSVSAMIITNSNVVHVAGSCEICGEEESP